MAIIYAYPLISAILSEYYLVTHGYSYQDIKEMDEDEVNLRFIILSQLFSDLPIRDKQQQNKKLPFTGGIDAGR